MDLIVLIQKKGLFISDYIIIGWYFFLRFFCLFAHYRSTIMLFMDIVWISDCKQASVFDKLLL